MKAVRDDYASFERWLVQLARFGNGQSQVEADFAQTILDAWYQTKGGFFGRLCHCGRRATTVRTVQLKPTFPREERVFCPDHAQALDQAQKVLEAAYQTEEKIK
jgi:hypothetical protein